MARGVAGVLPILAVIAFGLAVLAFGCGGGSGSAQGSERGPCYPNATCDDGLSCLSDFCVRVSVDGGAGAGGRGAAGGRGGVVGGGSGGAAGTGIVDAGFDVAAHAPLPQLADLGGPVVATPRVLPIFYAGDPDTTALNGFLARLTTGTYWHAATAEYGVGALSLRPPVTLPSASGTISDSALQSAIVANTGATGAWGVPDPNVIYLFALPPGTAATVQGKVCCTDFGGYHFETAVNGVSVPYIVSCSCPAFFGAGWNELDERTAAMGHELAEAATDPFPESDPAMTSADQANLVWTLVTQGEIGDMCAFQPDAYIRAAGTNDVVPRVWSNAAAKLGRNPCVPAPSAVPYFNSLPALDLIPIGSYGQETRGVQIPIGQSRTIDLDLFSVGPLAQDWTVSVFSYEAFAGGGAASLGFSLDRSTGRNGDVLHLTITPWGTNAQLGVDPFIVISTHGTSADPDYQSNVAMGLVTTN
jgi:hypothetical protein